MFHCQVPYPRCPFGVTKRQTSVTGWVNRLWALRLIAAMGVSLVHTGISPLPSSVRSEDGDVSEDIETLLNDAEAEFLDLFVAGPERIRWEELPPQVGDPAPDRALLDQHGDPVRLSAYWADHPALVVFWRHFGCGCGLERAERFVDEYDGYVDAGANVVIVGQGEPVRAEAYATEHGITCPILSDPDRKVYEAYGLLDLLPAQVLQGAPQPLLELSRDAVEELAADRRDSGRPLVDSPWQQPGEFVIDRDGTLRLTYRYQYCEDYPDPSVLETAIQLATD